MERLTKRDGGGNARMNCDDCDLDSSGRCGILQCRNQFIHRLAAYEDTGLDPEDIADFVASYKTMRDNEEARVRLVCGTGVIHPERAAEITKAEAEGRLLVLPCKIGAPVWFVVRDVDDPGRWEICEPQKVTEVGPRGFWISGLLDEPDGMHMFTPWSALGSEAFLSREAAEAKLKTLQNT